VIAEKTARGPRRVLLPEGAPRIIDVPIGRSPCYRLVFSGAIVRVPEFVRNWVGFLGYTDGREDTFRATAFIVYVHFSRGNGCHYYLVTARHNIDLLRGKQYFFRLNRRRRGTPTESVTVQIPESARWFEHPTESRATDVAVLPFELPAGVNQDCVWLSELATSDEDVTMGRIGCGSEGIIVGLFTPYPGENRNVPIVRTCHLAAIDDFNPLRIRAKRVDEPMEAYLVEVRSIGGLSGSPVFIKCDESLPRVDIEYDERYLLLGLVHGHWDVHRGELSKHLGVEDDEINSGIAAVVPAKKIVETVNHPELAAMRTQIEEAVAAGKAATAD
jgi:hypothetical protein